MLTQDIRIQFNQWLLGTLLAVSLLFVCAEQHAMTHAISHLSEEINHALKHDKTGQHSLCEECLCLDNLPDTLLPERPWLLYVPDQAPLARPIHCVVYSKAPYRGYAARAPPLLV